MLAGNSAISLSESEEQINMSQQSPKMLKMASESFIHSLLLVLGLFLKISRWVPLYMRFRIMTSVEEEESYFVGTQFKWYFFSSFFCLNQISGAPNDFLQKDIEDTLPRVF